MSEENFTPLTPEQQEKWEQDFKESLAQLKSNDPENYRGIIEAAIEICLTKNQKDDRIKAIQPKLDRIVERLLEYKAPAFYGGMDNPRDALLQFLIDGGHDVEQHDFFVDDLNFGAVLRDMLKPKEKWDITTKTIAATMQAATGDFRERIARAREVNDHIKRMSRPMILPAVRFEKLDDGIEYPMAIIIRGESDPQLAQRVEKEIESIKAIGDKAKMMLIRRKIQDQFGECSICQMGIRMDCTGEWVHWGRTPDERLHLHHLDGARMMHQAQLEPESYEPIYEDEAPFFKFRDNRSVVGVCRFCQSSLLLMETGQWKHAEMDLHPDKPDLPANKCEKAEPELGSIDVVDAQLHDLTAVNSGVQVIYESPACFSYPEKAQQAKQFETIGRAAVAENLFHAWRHNEIGQDFTSEDPMKLVYTIGNKILNREVLTPSELAFAGKVRRPFSLGAKVQARFDYAKKVIDSLAESEQQP